MSGWGLLFLGAIAAATVTMAALQIAAAILAARAARRFFAVTDRLEQELMPAIARLNAIAADAGQTAALVRVQVERADRLFADFVARAERTLTLVQNAVVTPAREGFAIIAGLRGALAALRHIRARAGQGSGLGVEEEDALFIG